MDGQGVWRCRLPDGSYNEVHHCYDFGTTLTTIGDLMTEKQKKEMVQFFRASYKRRRGCELSRRKTSTSRSVSDPTTNGPVHIPPGRRLR